MKKFVLAAVVAVSLAGCATAPSGLIDPNNLYPQALTKCTDEPVVPTRPADGKPRSESAKTAYEKNLHAAYEDCHDTVASWAERRALYVKQYEQATEGYFTRLWHAVTDETDAAK